MGERTYQIFVFRHGQTDWNREGRIQGHLDVPLNDTGREEAHRLALGFKRIRLDGILSSDLSRAHDTATLALAEAARKGWHPDVPIISDARLREIFLGKLQGLTKQEIREKFGDSMIHIGSKLLSDEDLRGVGSESAQDVLTRFFAALDDALIGPHAPFSETKSIGICTHGGVVRRLLHYGAGIEESPPVPNATFFQFSYEPEGKFFRFSGITALG